MTRLALTRDEIWLWKLLWKRHLDYQIRVLKWTRRYIAFWAVPAIMLESRIRNYWSSLVMFDCQSIMIAFKYPSRFELQGTVKLHEIRSLSVQQKMPLMRLRNRICHCGPSGSNPFFEFFLLSLIVYPNPMNNWWAYESQSDTSSNRWYRGADHTAFQLEFCHPLKKCKNINHH